MPSLYHIIGASPGNVCNESSAFEACSAVSGVQQQEGVLARKGCLTWQQVVASMLQLWADQSEGIFQVQ